MRQRKHQRIPDRLTRAAFLRLKRKVDLFRYDTIYGCLVYKVGNGYVPSCILAVLSDSFTSFIPKNATILLL